MSTPSGNLPRAAAVPLGPGRWAVAVDGEPAPPVVPEDIARAVAWWLNHGGLGYLESPRPGEIRTRVYAATPRGKVGAVKVTTAGGVWDMGG
jgi:hypothetical protein